MKHDNRDAKCSPGSLSEEPGFHLDENGCISARRIESKTLDNGIENE